MAVKTLYVGNLPYSVTESTMTTYFSNYGATNARIVEGRGFGFVDVDSERMDSAIADKHNIQMDGRTLTVSEAKPREPRSNNGGGSYGGGNGGGQSRGNRW